MSGTRRILLDNAPLPELNATGQKTAVHPDGDPLGIHGRRIGLEVTGLLQLLGIQPPFTTSLLYSWKLRSLLGIPEVLARLGGVPSLLR